MPAAGSSAADAKGPSGPRWLLAELSYRCPLRCVYCSNPADFAQATNELATDDWLRILRQARELGAVQLGLSGGEPLVRPDLEQLVREGRSLGYYSNLITSGIGLTERRLAALREAGLDHAQLSLQAARPELNDWIGGARTFDRKMKAAKLIKASGLPMVLNVVLHRHNIEQVPEILALAAYVGADYLELANAQYDGFAIANRAALLPTRAQLAEAEAAVARFRAKREGQRAPRVLYVVPDYFEGRPKPCGGGWAKSMLVVSPEGKALPCHGAAKLPLPFPNLRDTPVSDAWFDNAGFQAYRGESWMPEPCRSCPERTKDFGGCRCQAFLLTGDAAATDPACSRSPHHHIVADAVGASESPVAPPLLYRDGKAFSERPPT